MRGMEAELATAIAQPLLGPSASNSSISGSRECVKVENTVGDPFPAGLRVLVVDDDPICLLILDRMLRRCQYIVTTCGKATAALEMLRENRENFDLVISDVYMPDMDGFKLLELVGLEMDLPVIMMSANGETSAVMKGIKHGACDYLLKPVRIEELRNIWQHVVRKKWRASGRALSSSDDKLKRGVDDADYTSSANEGFDWIWKHSKKRKDIKEEEEEPDQDNEDGSTTKKPRVVWSVDLHQQFVAAVNQLGIDKAVPKRILELMNVHGLTRENVASHLQKYRLYLKRISGVGHQPGGLNSFAGSPDLNFGAASAGGLGGLGDLRTLAATAQLLPQGLVSTLQAGLFGPLGPPNNLGLGGADPSLLFQIAALQGATNGAVGKASYGHSLQNSQENLQAGASDPKLLTQMGQQISAFGQRSGSHEKRPPGMSTLQQQLAASASLEGMGQLVESNSNLQLNSNNNPLLMQVLQQQSGGHLTSEGGTTLPTVGILGQHELSTETVAWASPISSVTAAGGTGSPVQNASLLRPGPMSSLGRHTCADTKGLHVSSAGNMSLPVRSPIGVSSPLPSTELENDLGASRMRKIGSSLGAVCEGSPQNLHSFGPNFMSHSGLKHALGLNTGSRNRAGWEGFGLSQEFGQATSPVPSQRYSQVSLGSRGLNMGGGQEQGQIQAPGFGMGFRGNMSMQGGYVKASGASIISQSEQSTADSDMKVMQGNFGLLMGSKLEHGLPSEPLPHGLLNVILKRQQEHLGLTEGELAAADGYALDNMYVK